MIDVLTCSRGGGAASHAVLPADSKYQESKHRQERPEIRALELVSPSSCAVGTVIMSAAAER